MSQNWMTPEEREQSIDGVIKACKIAGGQRALSRKINLSHGTVHSWYAGLKPVPVLRAIQIEKVLEGAVSVSELRPDLKRCGVNKIYQSNA